MENEITIIDGQEYLNGQEAIGAKKIKVNDEKLRGISSHKKIARTVIPEESVIEEPVMEEKVTVEEPIAVDEPSIEDTIKFEGPVIEDKFDFSTIEKEEPVVEKSKVELEEQPVMEFAYNASRPLEEEIAPSKIKEIKELGDTYKGTHKTTFRAVEEAPKKKENEVTEEQFLSALKTESYSDKTREYKEATKEDYNNIINKLNAKNEEIEYIMNMYQNATEIGKNLQETIHKAQGTLNSINGLDLGFINEIKGEKSIALLKAAEDLFNENKEVVLNANAKLKDNAITKKEIGEKEQELKEKAREIKEELNRFIKEKYEKLVELNTIDEKFKEYDDNLTTITGITGKSVDEEREISTVSSISNLQDMPSMNMPNHFDSLREQPQTVVGVNSYGPSQNYNDVTFGGRVM